jgi:glutaredoxin
MLGQDLQALTTISMEFVEVEVEKNKTRKIKIKSKKSGNEATITYKYWEAIVRNGHGEEYVVLEENLG